MDEKEWNYFTLIELLIARRIQSNVLAIRNRSERLFHYTLMITRDIIPAGGPASRRMPISLEEAGIKDSVF